jgi:hypothetical protein
MMTWREKTSFFFSRFLYEKGIPSCTHKTHTQNTKHNRENNTRTSSRKNAKTKKKIFSFLSTSLHLHRIRHCLFSPRTHESVISRSGGGPRAPGRGSETSTSVSPDTTALTMPVPRSPAMLAAMLSSSAIGLADDAAPPFCCCCCCCCCCWFCCCSLTECSTVSRSVLLFLFLSSHVTQTSWLKNFFLFSLFTLDSAILVVDTSPQCCCCCCSAAAALSSALRASAAVARGTRRRRCAARARA